MNAILLKNTACCALLAVSTALAGCAAESDDTGAEIDDPGEVADEQDMKGRIQYRPASASVRWEPGCGMRMPDGRSCSFGLFLDVVPKYADLDIASSARWDAARSVVVVRVETSSTTTKHGAKGALQSSRLRLPNMPISPSTPTSFEVVDVKGRKLSSTTVRMIPAP